MKWGLGLYIHVPEDGTVLASVWCVIKEAFMSYKYNQNFVLPHKLHFQNLSLP